VTGFEKSGKVILKYVEQPLNIISQSHPPQVVFTPHVKDEELDIMSTPTTFHPFQFQPMQSQSAQELFDKHEYQNHQYQQQLQYQQMFYA
jgi:hypothetical protein